MKTPVLHQISLAELPGQPQADRALSIHAEHVWTHLDATREDAASWLAEHSELNDIAIEGLLAEETRPRLVVRKQRLQHKQSISDGYS